MEIVEVLLHFWHLYWSAIPDHLLPFDRSGWTHRGRGRFLPPSSVILILDASRQDPRASVPVRAASIRIERLRQQPCHTREKAADIGTPYF